MPAIAYILQVGHLPRVRAALRCFSNCPGVLPPAPSFPRCCPMPQNLTPDAKGVLDTCKFAYEFAARSNNFLNALRHSRSPRATGFEEKHAHNSQGLFAKALRPAIGPSSRKMSKVVGRHAPEARAFKRNRNLVPKTQATLQGGRGPGPTLLDLI